MSQPVQYRDPRQRHQPRRLCVRFLHQPDPHHLGQRHHQPRDSTFRDCPNLSAIYFKGDAPAFGLEIFYGTDSVTVIYMPGAIGWDPTFSDRPAVLWNPLVSGDSSFGVRTNQFGFNITGSSNLIIVVETCTDPVNPVWSPIGTNTITDGSAYFSDPDWTNYPARFYRLRSP